jgi:hypothetical protein
MPALSHPFRDETGDLRGKVAGSSQGRIGENLGLFARFGAARKPSLPSWRQWTNSASIVSNILPDVSRLHRQDAPVGISDSFLMGPHASLDARSLQQGIVVRRLCTPGADGIGSSKA